MKTAVLYVRVSTDEQADKGFSQRDQDERLRNYCERQGIRVSQVIYEDYSAKTFNRPAWTKFIAYLRRFRGKTDLVLFTKWDRFSRNAPDAYQMISTLKRLGVEPQAVEQPLDMDVPESKIMLAIYLTTPEVENDRRSLNVFYGMRRARKEGRWMARAPVGYKNITTEDGKKKIIISEPQASQIKAAFIEISKGRFSIEQVWRLCRQNGLKCSKNNFWLAIRNPIYCGKILITTHKEEQAFLVQGVHDPIISESLFYDVQDVLDGKKRKSIGGLKMVSVDLLPLRGFLLCPKCGKQITGSASKGRSQYYHYYHCSAGCDFRQKAEEVNRIFEDTLDDYVLNPKIAPIFKEVILDAYDNDTMFGRQDRKQYIEQITALNNKITKSRELLMNDDIDASDYKKIKSEAEQKIAVLDAKVASVPDTFITTRELNPLIEKSISILANIRTIYCNSDSYTRRKIIGSIYPQKIPFQDLLVRTATTSEPFRIMYLINKELEAEKNKKTGSNLSLSRMVFQNGFEPLLAESESDVLPLHYWKAWRIAARATNI